MAEAIGRPRLFLIAAALAIATAAPAQEAAVVPTQAEPVRATETLVIVADAEPDSKAKTIETRVQLGATKVLQEAGLIGAREEFPAGRVRAEQLNAEAYEILKRFITDGTLPRGDEADRTSMVADQKGAWRLNLGGPFALKNLDIVYESARTKARRVETVAPGGADGRIKIITPGRYLIHGVTQADPDQRPVQFVVRSFDGEKDRPELKIDVPPENTYWQIVVQDFPGNQKRLFEILADPDMFANPLVSKKLSERKLVLGSMVLIDRYGAFTITNNVVTFSFFKPAGSNPSRVWMKFPIEPEDVDAELKKYKDLDEFDLPARIRGEDPSLAGESGSLRPKPSPPRWYEIPLSGDGVTFVRSFELDQIDAWQARRNKGIHQLIVWELDGGPGGKAQAFILGNPATKEKARIKAEDVEGWPVRIQDARPGGDR
ncbi:MAG: hypothetical protein U0800_06900 [Isosphaeraceae bacterium]